MIDFFEIDFVEGGQGLKVEVEYLGTLAGYIALRAARISDSYRAKSLQMILCWLMAQLGALKVRCAAMFAFMSAWAKPQRSSQSVLRWVLSRSRSPGAATSIFRSIRRTNTSPTIICNIGRQCLSYANPLVFFMTFV